MGKFGIPEKQYGQIFTMKIDMAGSEITFKNTDPNRNRELLEKYHSLIKKEADIRNGLVGSWQGDGGIAILGTQEEENELIIHGEEMSRVILDKLLAEIPDKRFRIGVACEPGRFFEKIEVLPNRGFILAARLESLYGKKLANGSVLVCPANIYSALDKSVKQLYIDPNDTLPDGVKLYIYIPKNGGNHILPKVPPKTGGEPVQTSSTLGSAPLVGGDNVSNGSTEIQAASTPPDLFSLEARLDSSDPFLKRKELYFTYIIHPVRFPEQKISPRSNKDLIVQNAVNLLPLGSPIFEVGDVVRNDWYGIYVAEKEDAPIIQKCMFYPNRAFIFNDGGWSLFPGWEGVFYPGALKRPLTQISEFAAGYYSEILKYSDEVFITIKFKNIAGLKRKTSPGKVPPYKAFTYDRDLFAQVRVPVKDIFSEEVLQSLYNEIIKQSNLELDVWGWQHE